MFTASFYFLGVAVFVLAASVCLSWGKRCGKIVEVEIDTLRTVSVCLPSGRRDGGDGVAAALYKDLSWEDKVRWQNVKAMWTRWYARCQHEATLKQAALYSWSRTLALSAALCLVGVLLEAEFDQPITLRNVLAGFRRPCVAASDDGIDQLPLTRLIGASTAGRR